MDDEELAKPYAYIKGKRYSGCTVVSSKEQQHFWIEQDTNKAQANKIKLLIENINKLESKNAELKAQIDILMRVIKGR